MKFIDEAKITVRSGDGGNGCISFRRERFVPRGGPDGGDGGRGGAVIIEATERRRTLRQFQFKRTFKAQNGKHGQGKQKTGKNGDDIIIEVPPGTLVINAETGGVVKDFTADGERLVVAEGGRGGKGNKHFASSTNRAPRMAQPGESGQELTLKLELKLLADVGIIGFPNAGKSTLLRTLTAANPQIGDYPFTTLSPNLGVVYTPWTEPFVLADIPGLIEGAHQGAGLGIRFLKHIERTRVLIHLIDVTAIDPKNPLSGYDTINNELASYNVQLAQKPQLVAFNKIDGPNAKEHVELLRKYFEDKDLPIVEISALTRTGIDDLTSRVVRLLNGQ